MILKRVTNCVPFSLLFVLACTDPYGGDGESETCYTDCTPYETGTETGLFELQESQCVQDDSQMAVGVRHQCLGDVEIYIEFDHTGNAGSEDCADFEGLIPALPDESAQTLCYENHTIGAEPYDQARVASCCGAWGDESWELEATSTTDDPDVLPYVASCELDLAQQVCLSIQRRLRYHRDTNHFGAGNLKTQMNNMIIWLGENTPGCTAAIISNDSEATPLTLDSYYQVPNDAEKWPSVLDFTITVDVSNITGFTLPASEMDWIECYGIEGNDEWTLPEPWQEMSGNSYDTFLTSAMTVSLSGPVFQGGRVTASQPMHSEDNSCADPWCSWATYVEDTTVGGWEISEMEIYATDAVTMTNGTSSYDIEDVHISTIWAPGYIDYPTGGPTTYVIDAGDAWFALTGRGSGKAIEIPVSNSTNIEAIYSTASGEWSLSAFELEFIDYNTDSWEIGFPASTWE